MKIPAKVHFDTRNDGPEADSQAAADRIAGWEIAGLEVSENIGCAIALLWKEPVDNSDEAIRAELAQLVHGFSSFLVGFEILMFRLQRVPPSSPPPQDTRLN